MPARRRPRRRRPLTEFAQRSPLHAVAAAMIRIVLLATLALVAYLVIMNVLARTSGTGSSAGRDSQ